MFYIDRIRYFINRLFGERGCALSEKRVLRSQRRRLVKDLEFRCIVPPLSPVPDIAIIAANRLPEEDGPFVGSPDWVIEILFPGQSTLTLRTKILHFLTSGSKLTWLINLEKQIWVWQGEGLPRMYANKEDLPTLEIFARLTVEAVMQLTRRR